MMNREEFLVKLGSSVLVVCAGCGLPACSNENEPAPASVDLHLDLSTPPYAALNNVGGSVNVNNIIVARVSNIEFTALSRVCTHEGGLVNYRSAQEDFQCPNHGARFSTSGAVLAGPATKPLTKFNTELNGTLLRVFS
jgi:cytochrome b6-f complex iron-sulfur subunit